MPTTPKKVVRVKKKPVIKKRIKAETVYTEFRKIDTDTLIRPYDAARLIFIRGARIKPDQLQKIFGNKKGKKIEGERRCKIGLIRKDGYTIDGIAHSLWIENERYDTGEYRDAVEDVLLNYCSVKQMVEDIVNENKEKDYR